MHFWNEDTAHIGLYAAHPMPELTTTVTGDCCGKMSHREPLCRAAQPA